jgi:hypothetical protein
MDRGGVGEGVAPGDGDDRIAYGGDGGRVARDHDGLCAIVRITLSRLRVHLPGQTKVLKRLRSALPRFYENLLDSTRFWGLIQKP